MPEHYIYVPFRAARKALMTDAAQPFQQIDDMDSTLETTLSRYWQKYGNGEDFSAVALFSHVRHHRNRWGRITMRRTKRGRPLRGVGNDDTLLLFGHGNRKSTGIAMKLNESEVGGRIAPALDYLTVDEVADCIVKDGLSKKHRKIRCLVCYAGGDSMWQGDGPPVQTKFFAERLARNLGQRGYRQIVVGGFPSRVSIGPLGIVDEKLLTIQYVPPSTGVPRQKRIPTKGEMIYYDGQGRQVAGI